MTEQDNPLTIEEIKEKIKEDAEITGMVDSLLIEGIVVSEELIRNAVKSDRPKPDGTTTPNSRSDA